MLMVLQLFPKVPTLPDKQLSNKIKNSKEQRLLLRHIIITLLHNTNNTTIQSQAKEVFKSTAKKLLQVQALE